MLVSGRIGHQLNCIIAVQKPVQLKSALSSRLYGYKTTELN